MTPQKATVDDLDSLMQLDAISFPSEEIDRSSWEQALTRQEVWILRSGGALRGFLLADQDEHGVTLISRLGVHPNCRRQGYGTYLLQAALLHTSSARLIVGVRNRRAITLYEKLGFKVVEELASVGHSGHYVMHWGTR